MSADEVNDSHSEREGFFGAAKVVALLTLLSRVLGMLRDIAIVALGATRATDAFWTAFTVPNLFRRLFGEGAMSAAFVPVFTEVSEAKGWDKARLVFANVAGLLAVVLAGILVLAEIGLFAALLLAPGDWDRQLLLQLLMVLFPFMFFICLLALGSAALNCKGHFAYPAFAPVLLNVILIVAALLAHRFFPAGDVGALYVLGIAVVVAGVVQLGGVVWLLKSVDLRIAPKVRPVLPEAKRIARLVLPMMIPLGVMQFSAFFDRFYAWIMTAMPGRETFWLFGAEIQKPLTTGVVTRLYAANRLYQFPMGILGISLATVVFPLFSRYAARKDHAALRDTTNRAMRLALFLGIPAGLGLAILARPTIQVIYRHGRFRPEDVTATAFILQMYCLGMWAYFCNHILLRAFFAQQDTSTPLKVSLVLTSVNILLVVTLIFTPLRAGAMGLATAAAAAVNVLLLTWVLRRRWGRIGFRRILRSLARTAVAAGCMAGAVVAVQYLFGTVTDGWTDEWTGEVVALLAAVVAGGGVYAAVAAILRSEELPELLGAVRRKVSSTASKRNGEHL
ncbi:MAG: murein biosynthesis integral membrane protein MurJ [Phycisphaerae bacterium]